MTDPPARQIAERVREQQGLLLAVARDLSAEQFAASPGPHAPAIRFHLWHIARWADIVQANLAVAGAGSARGPATEIWADERLARAWGLGGVELGYRESGMGLPDEAAHALPLPDQATVLAYAERAFAAAASASAAVDDARFVAACRDPLGRETTVGGAILNHLLHVGRHLGMIEALRGILGLPGTATR